MPWSVVMDRLIGLETEYGLMVSGKDPSDLLSETAELIKCLPLPWGGPWDYSAEDPRRDARGFRVAELARNPEDAKYEQATPQMTEAEARCDRVLVNGARLYNDHGHPEYSTPECLGIRELIAQDKAGERILLQCAAKRAAASGQEVFLYKNNTDYHGFSYGCHENYLVRRDVPFEGLAAGLMPFFVTRQIFAGAGKVGVEQGAGDPQSVPFQLSQRTDYCTTDISVDTLHKRPIINTRDEPHANAGKWRRLHVICGDANMSEYAAALKVGTTCAVLSLLEMGWEPGLQVTDPVSAIKAVSHDQAFKWPVETGAGPMSATDVQRVYLEAAGRELGGSSEEADWALREWGATLSKLETEPLSLRDRLDWVAKRALLEEFIEAEGLDWTAPLLQGLDLEYHNLDPEHGLYYALEQSGEMLSVVEDEDIERALSAAPHTRAALRGLCVKRFAASISCLTWSRLWLQEGGRRFVVDFSDAVDGNVLQSMGRAASSQSVAELVEALGGSKHG